MSQAQDVIPSAEQAENWLQVVQRWVSSYLPDPWDNVVMIAVAISIALIPIAIGWGMFLRRVVIPFGNFIRGKKST